MGRSVAVVGSGPGGMYAVQRVLDECGDCRIDVIERLPSPFGLIRGGVAPDHQTTKNVSRAFEKTLRDPRVRYLGNVAMGHDVSLAELEIIYDAVILAYGAPWDRKLGIPGEDKKNVFGSNAFVGWYNCHPDFKDLDPDLDVAGVAVVGVGNVAVDCARVLAKTPKEMATTDLATYAAARIHAAPIKDIWMFGRRGPAEAAFTNVELRELGKLEDCATLVDQAHLPAAIDSVGMDDKDFRVRSKNLETMRGFTGADAGSKKKRMHIAFFASPVAVLGGERVEGIRMEKTRIEKGRAIGTGETFDVPCGLVITCIGSRAEAIESVPFDEKAGIVRHEQGRVRPGLYAVGWVKRGATGTIGTNRLDSYDVVDLMLKEMAAPDKPGAAALDRLLAARKVRVVGLADWQKIQKLEEANAPKGAPRRKFITPAEMLAALDKASAA
ncbi:MAG: hypothetical protein FJX67_00405 [Alphaproteobacteria bacterium]|nr:hypothetical protein [Alphaproteobacteria bacterium]